MTTGHSGTPQNATGRHRTRLGPFRDTSRTHLGQIGFLNTPPGQRRKRRRRRLDFVRWSQAPRISIYQTTGHTTFYQTTRHTNKNPLGQDKPSAKAPRRQHNDDGSANTTSPHGHPPPSVPGALRTNCRRPPPSRCAPRRNGPSPLGPCPSTTYGPPRCPSTFALAPTTGILCPKPQAKSHLCVPQPVQVSRLAQRADVHVGIAGPPTA